MQTYLPYTLTLMLCTGLSGSGASDVYSQSSQDRILDEPVKEVAGQVHSSPSSAKAVTLSQGQVPQGFNFQAVARDANGSVLTNQEISIELRILKGSDSGDRVYTETHSPTTDQSGQFQVVIGQGNTPDSFGSVNWAADTYFLGLAIDPAGGTDFEDLGATQLLSVPYALVAGNVIDGISVGEEPITQYHLNTSEGDTSFIINAAGTGSLSALRVNASMENQSIGVRSNVQSQSSSDVMQAGIWGSATGDATGSHYGLVGQGSGKGRYNYGVYGGASGEGSGEIVLIGEEDGFFGSFNIGGGFYASGNINGNLGVEGVASGDAGQRINIGVEGRAIGRSDSENIGVNGFAHNSNYVNFATSGIAEGENGRNVAIRGIAANGVSNVGGYFYGQDTSAVFHGPLTAVYGNLDVKGDITHNGDISQTSDRNLKQNILPVTHGIGTIMQLQPVQYEFRGNGSYLGLQLATGTRMGLIAQEVSEVLPSLVHTRSHTYTVETGMEAGPDAHTAASSGATTYKTMDYKTMNYTELIPVLIKAVQEQQEEIERLRDEIARMQN